MKDEYNLMKSSALPAAHSWLEESDKFVAFYFSVIASYQSFEGCEALAAVNWKAIDKNYHYSDWPIYKKYLVARAIIK